MWDEWNKLFLIIFLVVLISFESDWLLLLIEYLIILSRGFSNFVIIDWKILFGFGCDVIVLENFFIILLINVIMVEFFVEIFLLFGFNRLRVLEVKDI